MLDSRTFTNEVPQSDVTTSTFKAYRDGGIDMTEVDTLILSD